MKKEITIYKSKIFQEQVNSLTFKQNNFAYKKCRALVELIKAGLNISHLVKVENPNIELPLYVMKTQKDWRVILSLDDENKLIFLRMVTLRDVEAAMTSLNLEDITPYDFKEFW